MGRFEFNPKSLDIGGKQINNLMRNTSRQIHRFMLYLELQSNIRKISRKLNLNQGCNI